MGIRARMFNADVPTVTADGLVVCLHANTRLCGSSDFLFSLPIWAAAFVLQSELLSWRSIEHSRMMSVAIYLPEAITAEFDDGRALINL